MNWIPATQKPPAYQVVLLAFAPTGRMHDYTTGWWADRANGGKGAWVGLALNQSPPTYPLEDGAVEYWATIEAPKGKVTP